MRDPDLDTTRPFTRGDAIAAGLDPRLLRGSLFRRIFRGVYIDASTSPTPELRARAALTLFDPSAFASHASAARLHEVPIPVLPDEHVSVLEARARRPRPSIRCHVAAPDARIVILDGTRVSGYAQMFRELASLLGLVDLVVVGDNLVRRRRITCRALVEACRTSGLPGAALARLAATYVRDRVDSPMESRLRMLLVLAGLPEPEVNRTIRDSHGLPVRRYDLSYPEVSVVVEYDGRHHVERIESWEADLARREAIDGEDWRIIVVTARDLHRDPGRTILRVWTVLRERRMPGLPVRPGDGWRPYFPGRR